ncbi:isochorismatase family protein [Streptomyces sp. CAU 1734]|uniref:cysteine hydrolase family protein n=1 Tax=Streptomyces sp. CAU 1734 TaxID=3140360 RepID=UPI003260E3A6
MAAGHGAGAPPAEDAEEGGTAGFVRHGIWHSAPRRETAGAPAQALIVVDAQTAFLSGADAVPDAERVAGRIALLLGAAREAGALVAHLRNDGEPGAPDEPGTPGWELYLPVAESAEEFIVPKNDDDGFSGTPLGGLLAGRGVGRVVIAGVLSEMCVSATVFGALEYGLEVVLPHDAHGTYGLDDIPAAVVSRVAEHALGSDPELVRSAEGVSFTRPPGPRRNGGTG